MMVIPEKFLTPVMDEYTCIKHTKIQYPEDITIKSSVSFSPEIETYVFLAIEVR